MIPRNGLYYPPTVPPPGFPGRLTNKLTVMKGSMLKVVILFLVITIVVFLPMIMSTVLFTFFSEICISFLNLNLVLTDFVFKLLR